MVQVRTEMMRVWCRPYLAANFGLFDLRTFLWSPSKVEVGRFYPFTLKVGPKDTYITLGGSSAKPTINITTLSMD